MTKSYKLYYILLFIFHQTSYGQVVNLDSAISIAIDHRQTQNAAHHILWGISHNVMEESWEVNQEKGEMIVQRGTSTITSKIKIIGTYDHKDSTFLWSVYNKSINQNLTQPVSKFITIAKNNNWKITDTEPRKCSFQEAYNLSSLVSYYENANGISNKITNQNRTNVIFAYYDVEIKDRVYKVFNKTIPTKKQYKFVNAPNLIEICKKYTIEFGNSEKKYYSLYKSNKNKNYMDTMFNNRVKISDEYWDTTSIAYPYFRENRLQAQDLKSINNWRVILIDDEIFYVLYDEKEIRGQIKTWAFEMCKINNQYKIRNQFLCF